MRMLATLFSLLALLLFAVPATAQTVVTATSGVEFDPSADHALVVGGVPVVSVYSIEIHTGSATGNLVATVVLGKPAPVLGKIRVKPIPELGALPSDTYVAIPIATGPGGATAGPPSDPFVRVGKPGAPGKAVILP